ncbi:MAG: hypothetical protein U9O78_02185 [Patescibacteria group bacterium]|nr:hypothetical protein [Patescibacteria group bacterium]
MTELVASDKNDRMTGKNGASKTIPVSDHIEVSPPREHAEDLQVEHPVNSLHWTEEKKVAYTKKTKIELTEFLEELGVGVGLVQQLTQRYENNALLYRETMIGPTHDEYHMAKVVHWAMDIWDRRKKKFLEEKKKFIVLALAIAAIEHDRADAPKKGEVFTESQHREADSARGAAEFIDNMELPEEFDSNELKSLVKLMIATTSQSLEISWVGENLDDLNTTKLIRGEEVDEDAKEQAGAEVELAKMARDELIDDFNWSKDLLLESVRMLNASDYASYFFEPADIIEVIALLVEKEELFVRDGVLLENEKLKDDYIKFLGPAFKTLIYRYYHDYYPQDVALAALKKIKENSLKLEEIKAEKPHDPLLRLEGGLTPRTYFVIIKDLHLERDSIVQLAAVKYSKAYREAFSHPDAANFHALATDLIRALWLKTEETQKGELIKKFFEQIEYKANREGMTVDMYLSPLAYQENFNDEELRNLAAIEELDPATSPNFMTKLTEYMESGFESDEIKNVSLALRVDHGDVDKVNFADISTEFELSLAGIPNAENMISAIQKVEKACSGRKITVHAGIGKNPQAIFDKVYHLSQDSNNEWVLHLDGRYTIFNTWFSKIVSDYTELDFPIIVSPLVNLMTGDRATVDALVRLQKSITHLSLSSNNATMAGGGSQALQILAFELIAGGSHSSPDD